MKKIFLTTVALASLAGAAYAADLPGRRMAPAPFVAVPAFTWAGFYVGLNAGYAWSGSNNNNGGAFAPAGTFTAAGAAFTPTSGTFAAGINNGRRGDGFAGGGQAGYNWQMGTFVFGLETDIQGVAGNHNRNNLAVAAAPLFTVATGPGLPAGALLARGGVGSVDWFGTVRARAGFAMDRALIYATGGFAYGGGGGNNNFCGLAFGCGGNSNSRTGYTLGGGVEYAFTDNLSAKLEGLYVNLGNNRRNAGVVYNVGTNTVFVNNNGRSGNDFGVIRAGLNYRFNTF